MLYREDKGRVKRIIFQLPDDCLVHETQSSNVLILMKHPFIYKRSTVWYRAFSFYQLYIFCVIYIYIYIYVYIGYLLTLFVRSVRESIGLRFLYKPRANTFPYRPNRRG